MNSVKLFVLLTVLIFVFPPIGIAQEKATEQLGKVHFPVSCSPKAQEQFERGVAMLALLLVHRRRQGVRRNRQTGSQLCRWLTGGYAVNLLGNTLSTPPLSEKLASGVAGARTGPRDWGRKRSASATGSKR